MRRKTVVVLESGRLPELNIAGPITVPTRIALTNIATMVKNGKNVEECDPADPYNKEKRVKLTIENVGKDNFANGGNVTVASENKVEIEEDVKKPEETPVEKVVETEVSEPKKEEAETVAEESVEVEQKSQQNQNNFNNQKKNNKKK